MSSRALAKQPIKKKSYIKTKRAIVELKPIRKAKIESESESEASDSESLTQPQTQHSFGCKWCKFSSPYFQIMDMHLMKVHKFSGTKTQFLGLYTGEWEAKYERAERKFRDKSI